MPRALVETLVRGNRRNVVLWGSLPRETSGEWALRRSDEVRLRRGPPRKQLMGTSSASSKRLDAVVQRIDDTRATVHNRFSRASTSRGRSRRGERSPSTRGSAPRARVTGATSRSARWAGARVLPARRPPPPTRLLRAPRAGASRRRGRRVPRRHAQRRQLRLRQPPLPGADGGARALRDARPRGLGPARLRRPAQPHLGGGGALPAPEGSDARRRRRRRARALRLHRAPGHHPRLDGRVELRARGRGQHRSALLCLPRRRAQPHPGALGARGRRRVRAGDGEGAGWSRRSIQARLRCAAGGTSSPSTTSA